MTTPPEHFDDELQELLDGRLAAPRQAEVERHLESCAKCQRTFAALQWTKQTVAIQSVPAEAPAELRAQILRALRPVPPPAAPEPTPPHFGWWFQWKPAFALAAITIALALLAFLLFPKSPGMIQTVAQDFQAYQKQKLPLAFNTTDVKAMETFFATHGATFNTRVFDLGMMNYQLVGGRVRPFRHQPTALFVYHGPANEVLHCRMYAGKVSDLPAGSVERENQGIKFHIYQTKGITMVFWQEGGVVCVLSSDIATEQVVQLAFAKAMPPV